MPGEFYACGCDSNSEDSGSATLFIFLTASTRTRIVATNLRSGAHHLLDLHVAGSGHTRLLQFLFLPALEGFFDFVNRGGDLPRWASIAAPTACDDGWHAGFESL